MAQDGAGAGMLSHRHDQAGVGSSWGARSMLGRCAHPDIFLDWYFFSAARF